MGFPVKAVMTYAGLELLGRVHDGESFEITRAVMGEGELNGQDQRALEDVIAPVMEARKAHVSPPKDGSVIARFDATRPEDIPRDFLWREFGVYVMDRAAGREILYIYNHAVKPDHISQGEAGMRSISLPIKIGEADNVIFELDQSVMYALADELEGHALDQNNPHKVTLGQVLGGGAAEGVIDCGYWGAGSAVRAHNANRYAHGGMTLDGNAFGEYEAGDLAAHETDPNVHPALVVDGNVG